MSIEPQRVRLSIAGAVARLTFVNASRRNVIDRRFTEEFLEAARSCAEANVAVVVVAAEGEAFSVGGDIDEFVAQSHRIGAHVAELAHRFHEGVLALQQSSAAIVVALTGMAAGGGFSLVCGADLVIAARSARLCSAYARSGLTPDGGGTWFLPRLVGRQRAFDLLALSPMLSAADAHRIGIVSRVVDDDRLTAVIEDCVGQLAALAPGVLAGIKRLLREDGRASLEKQLEREARGIAELAASPATMALLAAFVGRRR
jgi:2-(1,2-epoxy-1,2-dihydrophenyl)acetyl-CoA isomerase